MAETDGTTGEKLVSGPPPKLDLRKTVATTPPVVPPPVPVVPVGVPAAPRIVAGPAKSPTPVIKLGFSAEPEVRKPVVATPAGKAQPVRGPILASPLKKPSSAPPMTRVPAAVVPGPTPVSNQETSKIPLEKASPSAEPKKVVQEVPVVPPAAAAVTPMSKAETSRIPLEKAMGVVVAQGAASMAPKISSVQPGAAEVDVKTSSDEKRMTSRINLEAALATDKTTLGKPGDTGPKTIRLKRPGDSATIKAMPRPKLMKTEESAGTPAMNRTARLDVPDVKAEDSSEDAEESSTTRRKTIRIKRPAQGVQEDSPVVIARAGGAAEAGDMAAMPFSIEDEPHFVFLILAIAAVLVIIVTIYMFAVQVFPGADLSWPGKIIVMQ
jgi:hypothetical protein